ncbi:MAG: response regulator transcription factor [Anaerolineales bacterium]|nr:response regulator transcription factor [Anaerolineales bacterium]
MSRNDQPPATPIRLLIVDDSPSVRQGLTLMLQVFDDLQLVGQAADGEAALRMYAEARPDVVLMDLLMPVMDGLTATQALRARYPEVRVVALTSYLEEAVHTAALAAGARTCLGKHVSIDELADAIRTAAAG